MDFKISLFKHKRDVTPQLVTRSWAEICERFSKPRIRAEKDGPLFSPAIFVPPQRLNNNARELSLLVLDCDHAADFDPLIVSMRLLTCAFAIYSTHSHCRVTDSNPSGEPRFRVVIPLMKPIPAAQFPLLWTRVAKLNGLTVDRQAKDPSRMFYTPAKASKDAPYVFHIEENAFLDWSLLSLARVTNGDREQDVEVTAATARSNGHFTCHEERHAELVRRVQARACLNPRGNYDAACFAHNGKGKTSLVYFPNTGAVKCNKSCDYHALLRAEGLPDTPLPSRVNTTELTREQSLRIVCMANVVAEDVTWLWAPYIPIGKLTILEGDPGIGKSWLTCAIASAVSTGHGLPNTAATEPRNVLILTAEDGLGDTLKPRLNALEADTSRVFAVDEPLVFDETGLLYLEAGITDHKPAIVLIDPLFAYTGGKMDIHRANECRGMTAKLAEIAENQKCAILAIRHLGKSRGNGFALNAGIGSIDITAAARSVLLAGIDPNNPIGGQSSRLRATLRRTGQRLASRLRVVSSTGREKVTSPRKAFFLTLRMKAT
jgi:DNA repair protein RadA/Sms